MKYVLVLVFLLGIVTLLFAGCTANEHSLPGTQEMKSFSTEGGYGEAEYTARDKVEMAYEAPVPAPAMASQSSMQTVSPSDQKIIKTADISLETQNVSITTDKVTEVASRFNGTIQSSLVSAGRQDRYTGSVTIRVPVKEFDPAVAGILVLGKVLSSSLQAEDVTEQYVDLEAQKNALVNQLVQYNRIMAKGENVSDILEVQREIERVQVELDRIVGKMKYLESRTSYSTIPVRISEPAQVEPPGGYSFAAVVNDGIAGFIDMVVWLFIAILTLLPLILLGAAGYLVYRRWKRRRMA
ncbi:MAG: DUF4349 domain-containing protein [Methanospirillum sp.]|nr:DUF4349 domain-containing protein [Methanospirillum sp.]